MKCKKCGIELGDYGSVFVYPEANGKKWTYYDTEFSGGIGLISTGICTDCYGITKERAFTLHWTHFGTDMATLGRYIAHAGGGKK